MSEKDNSAVAFLMMCSFVAGVVALMWTVNAGYVTYNGGTGTVEKSVCVEHGYAWSYGYPDPSRPQVGDVNLSAEYVEGVSDYTGIGEGVYAHLNYSEAVEAGVIELPKTAVVHREKTCVERDNVTVEVGEQ